MPIIGAHTLIYSSQAEELRDVFREVFGLDHVDAGHGWLIFNLPPAEIAVHPAAEDEAHHEVTLMCDNLETTMATLSARGIEFVGGVHEEPWGLVTRMRLPGDVEMMLYEPRHPTAI